MLKFLRLWIRFRRFIVCSVVGVVSLIELITPIFQAQNEICKPR